MGVVINDICDLCKNFNFVVWSFVKQGGSKVANALIDQHIPHFGEYVWTDNIIKGIC